MFHKSSVPLILLFFFISCNAASPALRQRRDLRENSLLPKDVEESVKQLTNEIEKSVKHLTQNSQWIYNNVLSIIRTSLENGVQTVASWMLDLVARMEFLTMADGSHMFFPRNGKPEIEQDYKTVAIAVSKLLMNLRTMERTDKLLKNVSRSLVTNDIVPHFKEQKMTPEKMFRTFLHLYFEALDQHMETDESLGDEYKKLKEEAREAVKQDPEMRETIFKVWEKYTTVSTEEMTTFLTNKKTLRQADANKLFMKQSAKHISMIFSALYHRRYLLARALIQKAHSSNSDSNVEKIYHQALARTLELSVNAEDDEILNALFHSIENALESEPTLKTEIEAVMKQIEGSTIYDTDMLQMDFSLI